MKNAVAEGHAGADTACPFCTVPIAERRLKKHLPKCPAVIRLRKTKGGRKKLAEHPLFQKRG